MPRAERVVDLRSDTLTQPTAGMRRAIAEAVVGDEQRREDPTVNQLEARVAELLGHEDSVFVPSATMANQIALRLLSVPGDAILGAEHCHIFNYEVGGPAVHSGLVMKTIRSRGCFFLPEELRAAFEPVARVSVGSRVLTVENTYVEAGGRVWPIDQLRQVLDEGRALGLNMHLDGARLMNAVVAAGMSAATYARRFDTVSLCLTKGLGCPVGALLAGDRQRMEQARRLKQLFGGAMRQSGILAAAGLYALDHHITRLAEDHANARRLAEGLSGAGMPVDPRIVETNVVLIEVGRLGLSVNEAIARFEAAGVLLSASALENTVRALTYLGITADDVDLAIDAMVHVAAGIAR